MTNETRAKREDKPTSLTDALSLGAGAVGAGYGLISVAHLIAQSAAVNEFRNREHALVPDTLASLATDYIRQAAEFMADQLTIADIEYCCGLVNQSEYSDTVKAILSGKTVYRQFSGLFVMEVR